MEIAEADETLQKLGGNREPTVEVALPGTEIVRRLIPMRRTERDGR